MSILGQECSLLTRLAVVSNLTTCSVLTFLKFTVHPNIAAEISSVWSYYYTEADNPFSLHLYCYGLNTGLRSPYSGASNAYTHLVITGVGVLAGNHALCNTITPMKNISLLTYAFGLYTVLSNNAPIKPYVKSELTDDYFGAEEEMEQMAGIEEEQQEEQQVGRPHNDQAVPIDLTTVKSPEDFARWFDIARKTVYRPAIDAFFSATVSLVSVRPGTLGQWIKSMPRHYRT